MRIRSLSLCCLLWIASVARGATQISFREFPLSNPPTYTVTGITSDDVGEILWGTDNNFRQIVSIDVETGEVNKYSARPPSGDDVFLIGSPQAATFNAGSVWFPAVFGFGTATPRSVIGRFNPSTTSLEYFNTVDPSIFASAQAYITRGDDGNAWYAGSVAGKVGKITPAGVATEFNVATASGSMPQVVRGIAFGENGHVYLTSDFRNIYEFDPAASATILHRIEGGSYRGPAGIVQGPDSAMYIGLMGSTADGGNKILRLSYAGLQTEWAIPTANSGVTALALGSNGKIYGTEQFAKQILEFNVSTHEMSESAVPNGKVPLGITAVASTGKTRIAFNAFPSGSSDGAAQLAEIGGDQADAPDLFITLISQAHPSLVRLLGLVDVPIRAGSEGPIFVEVKNESTTSTNESTIEINYSVPPHADVVGTWRFEEGPGTCDRQVNSEGGSRMHCTTTRRLAGGQAFVITGMIQIARPPNNVASSQFIVETNAEVRGGGDPDPDDGRASKKIKCFVDRAVEVVPVVPDRLAIFDPSS